MAKRFSKVRKQEILFKKSLFRFSLTFLFVLIAGGVSNYSLSKIPLKEKLLASLKLPASYQLDLHQPRFRFAQGIMPVIGVGFQRVELHESSCVAKRMLAHDVLLVLNPWRLLKGEIKLGWVNIDFLELDYPESCGDQPKHSSQVSTKGTNKNSLISSQPQNLKELQEKAVQEIFDHAQRIKGFKKMSYLMVDSFSFRGLHSMNDLFVAKGYLSAKIKNDISVELRLQEFFYKDSKVPLKSTQLNFTVKDDLISGEVKSSIREGSAHLKFDVKNVKEFPTKLGLKIKKVPVSTLGQFFLKENQINYLWGSCSIKVESTWRNLLNQPLDTENCLFDGPYGGIVFSEVDATLRKFSQFKAQLKQIQLDQIIKSRRDLYLSGVFANYGTLSAQIEFIENQFGIEGFLENSEFIFSQNNLRDIQKVKKIPFFFKGNKKRWQSVLTGIELDGGEFQGDVKIQMNPQEKFAQGKISIQKLRFNPRIYKLVLDAKPTDLKVYGKFSMEDSRVKDWSALIVAPLLRSESYELSHLKIQGQRINQENSQIKISVASGVVKKSSKLISWMLPTFLNGVVLKDSISFKELSTKLNVFVDQRIQWLRGYARLSNGWQLSTEGRRDVQRRVSGWLQWDKPNRQYLKWSFEGELFQGKWRPETAWVKTWLDGNPQYLDKFPSVLYEATKTESLGAKINSVGKKAIKKVKSVLGRDKNKEKP